MKIENYKLITDVGVIDLPHLAQDSIVRVWEVPTEYRESGLFVTADPTEIPACDHGAPVFEHPLPAHPDAVAAVEQAALIKRFDGVVQSHIDGVARSFGYGDPNRPEISPILHAISYADEPAVPRFQAEGQALRAWRSLVWAKCAGILNAVKAGERAIPTEAELLAELPDPPTQDPL